MSQETPKNSASMPPLMPIINNQDGPTPHSTPFSNAILSSLPIGIIAYDQTLRILNANAQARKNLDLGAYIDVSLAAGTDERVWGNWREFLLETVISGKRREFARVKYQTGARQRLFHLICTPVTDACGGPILAGVVLINDVTDQADTEHQLAQAERLAAIGKVAGRVAHELNNPIDGILRYINLASRIIDQGDHQKAKEYLQQSRSGLMRMVQILGELLEFSRSTWSALDYATVDRIAADAVKTVEARAEGVQIRIVHDCPHSIGPVRVMSLFQIFCNLIKNAVDAMEGHGTLTIRITCPEDVLKVEFRDTGRGFAPEDAVRIFEPFYTTKGPGKGTGLGLSICKDIIEKYGGRITAENAPEGGGIFTVHLPLTQAVLKRQE